MEETEGYVLEVGQGIGSSFGFEFPAPELLLNPLYANKTIRQIAKSIAKMEKVKHGEVVLYSIKFSVSHRDPKTINEKKK